MKGLEVQCVWDVEDLRNYLFRYFDDLAAICQVSHAFYESAKIEAEREAAPYLFWLDGESLEKKIFIDADGQERRFFVGEEVFYLPRSHVPSPFGDQLLRIRSPR